jgi:hypothetical protein
VKKQIEGSWNGWSGDTVVELTNGNFLQQAEYLYEYRYAYRPMAEMVDGTLAVDGMSRAVKVRQIDAVRGTVNGEWKGWDGKTIVELTDGSRWQQAEYRYEYRYAYRPDVIIFDDKMQVEDMDEAVRVRRIG